MAEVIAGSRRPLNIRARINTYDEPADEIKAQLENANRTQRALRSRISWRPSHVSYELVGGLQRANAALRRKTSLRKRRESSDQNIQCFEPVPIPLKRSCSFNSLSTLQRANESAALSQWRGSPISAISSPLDDIPQWIADSKPALEDPCPPLGLYTIKQARKDEKLLRKTLKKRDKEQRKADKAAGQKLRDFKRTNTTNTGVAQPKLPSPLRNDVKAAKENDTANALQNSKSIAGQIVKRLTLRDPIVKLKRRSRTIGATGPANIVPGALDTFDPRRSGDETQDQPAELPATLPPYTRFEDSTATADNERAYQCDDGQGGLRPSQAQRRRLTISGDLSRNVSKMMRCDTCQFGIKLNEVYYHCSICDDGDRILCRACDATGCGCRHDLTERVRQILRYDSSSRIRDSPLRRKNHQPDDMNSRVQLASAGIPHDGSTIDYNHLANALNHSQHQSDEETKLQQLSRQLQELDLKKREQDILFREKELSLRERESALREQQATLREREAVSRDREATLTSQLRLTLAEKLETAAFTGSQFQTYVPTNVSAELEMPESSTDVDKDSKASHVTHEHQFLPDLSLNAAHVRTYAQKRKANGQGGSLSSSNSTENGRLSLRPIYRKETESNDEDDEDNGSETPKRVKQDPEAASTSGKLFACPFCKYDSNRYSERNGSEKQYRGCSSGYWTDISRLKQHLYRVHWRRIHCQRCFEVFKTKPLLDQHLRQQNACEMRDCPFEEKFTDLQYNEIRRKRPANNPKEVWYIIYGILFPGADRPLSPYADNTETSISTSPVLPAGTDTLDILGEVFESRLNQHQDGPQQAWLRMPGAREFLREQLRESMAEVIRQLSPVNSPSNESISAELSPRLTLAPVSTARNFVSQTPATSFLESPAPASATSTRSTSSSQWFAPSHSRSFSRPFQAQSLPQTPVDVRNYNEVSSNVSFAVPAPLVHDPENDQYDSESGSWHQGDEAMGIAITTDCFDFNLEADSMLDIDIPVIQQVPQQTAQIISQPNSQPDVRPLIENAPSRFKFKPVKLASIADTSQGHPTQSTDLKPNRSNASIDSGYGSLGSRPSTFRERKQAPELVQADLDEDDDINLEALRIPFSEFLGADMDEMGNVAGKSLTEYLDTRYTMPPTH